MSAGFLVGTRKGLFSIQRSANGWSIERADFLGDPVTMTLVDPRDHSTYAALHHGHFGAKLHRREAGADTWEEIGLPTYPEKPEDVIDPDPNTSEPRKWALELIWSLEAGPSTQPGRLWCGTVPGGLFRSDDRGQSWSLVEPLWNDPSRSEWFGGAVDSNQPGLHSILIDPRDPDRLVVGISCGGVWESKDAGDTWSVRSKGLRAAYMPPERALDPHIQDPHLISWSPVDPDQIWCQHHNGIFLSRDGALNWTELDHVKPSGFGFAVAVHPQDPQRAWFIPGIKDEQRIPVGGQLVVTRTTDGGKTFETLRNGLPQEHAYDIVLRHALAVDATGEVLAFGSTTGSVFISEDGGEHWQQVTGHLPPIYVVKAHQSP